MTSESDDEEEKNNPENNNTRKLSILDESKIYETIITNLKIQIRCLTEDIHDIKNRIEEE